MIKHLNVIVAGILLFLGVFLGAFSVSQKEENTFHDIYYDNVQYTDNVTFYGMDGFNFNYSGNLSRPGDFYEIHFDVVNSTDTDFVLRDCNYPKNDDFIEYQLTYDDGEEIQVGDILRQGEVKHLNYRVFYKSKILSESYEFDSSFFIDYQQYL